MKNTSSTLSGLKKYILTKVNIQSEIQFWADRYLTVIDIILLCCERVTWQCVAGMEVGQCCRSPHNSTWKLSFLHQQKVSIWCTPGVKLGSIVIQGEEKYLHYMHRNPKYSVKTLRDTSVNFGKPNHFNSWLLILNYTEPHNQYNDEGNFGPYFM